MATAGREGGQGMAVRGEWEESAECSCYLCPMSPWAK